MLFGRTLTCFAIAAIVISTSVGAQTTVVVDGLGGDFISLAEVDGRPALAYDQYPSLWYVRANDSKGMTWGSPILVNPADPYYSRPSLNVVNGHPAVCVFEPSAEGLVFIRANEPTGSSWSSPVTVATGFWDPRFTSLEIVNGRPAVCGSTDSSGPLVYTRASDSNGSTWNAPMYLPTSVAWAPSFTEVVGNPAYAYIELTATWELDLAFVRALDVNGDSWGPKVTVVPLVDVKSPSMAILGGNPAIAYYDDTNGDLMLVRANTADGGSWGSPVALDSDDDVGNFASFEIVDGIPMISYFDATNSRLKMIQAADQVGDEWHTPIVVDPEENTGYGCSLASINDLPSIGYNQWPDDNLKFALDIPVFVFVDSFESGDTDTWASTVP